MTDALTRAGEKLGAAVRGLSDAAWSRRPDGRNWSAKEIVCHLRDVEELFLVRFMTMLANDEPTILAFSATPEALAAWGIGAAIGHPLDPDRTDATPRTRSAAPRAEGRALSGRARGARASSGCSRRRCGR